MQRWTNELRERLLEPGHLEVIIGAVTFLAYVATLGFSFVYDDNGQIVNNPTITSWRYVPDYFTNHFWFGIASSSGYYRPFTLLWSRLNFVFFGFNPAGWHFTTVLAHVTVTLLVFRLALYLFRERPTAAITALIFGLHPLHVETASWICAASDSITASFMLGSFLMFLSFRDECRLRALIISLILFFCALLTKEPAIVLLPVVFAFELIAGKSLFPQRMRHAAMVVLPFGVPVAIYLVARHHAMQQVVTPAAYMSMSAMWLTLPSVVCFYVEKLLVPIGLSPFYGVAAVTSPGFKAFWIPLVALAALIAAMAFFGRRLKEGSVLAFALAWMLITLSPALYVRLFHEGELVQDRYAYIASIGFVIAIAVFFRAALFSTQSTFKRVLSYAVVPSVLLLCFVGTIGQELVWANDVTLFSRGFYIAPNDEIAANNAAWSMAITKHYPEAIGLFRKLLERHPEDVRARRNLGIIYLQVGNVSGAEDELGRALKIEPEGEAFFYLGLTHMQQGQFALADRDLRNSASFDANRKGLHIAMATLRALQSDFAGAVREGEIEATLFPDDQRVQQLLAGWRTQLSTR
jgi:tetratricopeptide (TPR) repeat protein